MGTRIHIFVSDELLGRIDQAKGDVSRSRWITRALERELSGEPVASRPLGATPSADKSFGGLPLDRSAASVPTERAAPESRAEMFRRMQGRS